MNKLEVIKNIPVKMTFVDTDINQVKSVTYDIRYSLKTEASDTESLKLLLKIFCKSFKKILEYNINPIIPYLRMKNK